MTFPDLQSSRWMLYSGAAAVSTVLFLATGMSGIGWVNRAATRIGVICALATIFCTTTGISTFLQRKSAPASSEPQAIEWCKRVSCTLQATTPTTPPPRRR